MPLDSSPIIVSLPSLDFVIRHVDVSDNCHNAAIYWTINQKHIAEEAKKQTGENATSLSDVKPIVAEKNLPVNRLSIVTEPPMSPRIKLGGKTKAPLPRIVMVIPCIPPRSRQPL
jgi:hypothetical protein